MKLNQFSGLYFIINSILCQSQDAQITAKNTLILLDRLKIREGNNCFEYEAIERAMNGKPVLHRFPRRMTLYLVKAMERLKYEYLNNAVDVFLDESGTLSPYDIVINRLVEFTGIGFHKAQVTYYKVAMYISEMENLELCLQVQKLCPALVNSLSKEFEYMKEWGMAENEESLFGYNQSL